jgi:iron complex transport system ATP-binding protein
VTNSTTRQAIVECQNVHFGYADRPVLDGVSLTIHEGDFIGVIGPNGAGKSTLIKTLTGLRVPSQGSVHLNGVDVRHLARNTLATELAVVEQEEPSGFGFAVREHVAMGRAPHHGGLYFEATSDRLIVEKALMKSRVDHLADRCMDALSGGERQRVRLARSLAQQPRVLFLDEPTNHLDLYSQLSLIELLREINGAGMAVFVVSHDINFVSACCNDIKILHGGKFLREGPPQEVITADNLQQAFSIRALVDVNPSTYRPRMTPLERLDDPVGPTARP